MLLILTASIIVCHPLQRAQAQEVELKLTDANPCYNAMPVEVFG